MSGAAPAIEILAARAPDDVRAVKSLVIEYADFLKEDLCFQGFEEEIGTFPVSYELLLLAKVGGAPAACIALKALEDGVCEMKRLYARPAFRGRRLGEKLSIRLIEEARRRDYRVMRLDTLERLKDAIALYRRLGFTETKAYYENPLSKVMFMELPL